MRRAIEFGWNSINPEFVQPIRHGIEAEGSVPIHFPKQYMNFACLVFTSPGNTELQTK